MSRKGRLTTSHKNLSCEMVARIELEEGSGGYNQVSQMLSGQVAVSAGDLRGIQVSLNPAAKSGFSSVCLVSSDQ